ncbi:cysteine--tRNA ligase [Lactobacillus sp. ESL0230]|uniref:cysteine--tRNA ligase n=1 Tax=Lactobacillus sp. ESL0230 TaxID=2069353 RepID=UPI000EFB9391|nr:cysteine--tRNA ligase [Lactobacillus sp. ESL0230]RMC45239.1 cysteine--tRNA ligase [Lactobacillus sp. ESL0230]
MKIYNTLTKTKEEFRPIKPGEISMYVCGPTVYNYIHIGNARSVVAFDTIRRYFEYKGYRVNYVSNFTDVDDKMINEARVQKISVSALAQHYIEAYRVDTAALNVQPATLNPRATNEITAIIKFIQQLITKGYAYESAGDVYYRTRKFANYGALSSQNITELEAGASEHVNVAEQKRKEDPLDFALWKKQKQADEIAWASPWSLGRPGWHIECSVMSTKYLGNTIDIHGGGQDLEFPHHENEIAQSEAATGEKFVHYWMHNGFVTVGADQAKMSKSLHNFVTVHDLLKTTDPQVLRFFMASVHYRRPINYSTENLEQAKNILQKFKNTLVNLAYRLNDSSISDKSPAVQAAIAQTERNFIKAMDDDLNVQNALAAIYDLLPILNANLSLAKVDKEALKHAQKLLTDWLGIFGISTKKLLTTVKKQDDDEIVRLVAQREQARKNKEWAKSDELRDKLKAMGITVEDTPQGTRWRRD